MSDSSNANSTIKPQNCDCYKKLHLFGVPLYISEENEEYSERNYISYDNAFQLPGPLKINGTITDYPIVEENQLSFVFQEMAKVIPNLSDFEMNVLSFWILDVFIEGLWTAQNAFMPHEHQKATLEWIAFFFNYIQKSNPTRKEMFIYLKSVLFQPRDYKLRGESFGELEGEESNTEQDANKVWELPLPPGVERSREEENTQEYSVSRDDLISTLTSAEALKSSSSSKFSGHETTSERNVRHMNIILEILYRIFGRHWVFLEIQTAFHAMPSVEQVDLPFALNVPKRTFKPPASPAEKSGKKPPPAPEKTAEEIETERQSHKNHYILPLQEAEEAELYTSQLFGSFTDCSPPVKGKVGKK